MKDLSFYLHNMALFEEVYTQLLQRKSLLLEEIPPAAKALVCSWVQSVHNCSLLILTGSESEESQLCNDIPFFSKSPVIEVPAWETLPSEEVAPSPDITGTRLTALTIIAQAKAPVIVLTSLQGALQKVPSQEIIAERHLTLSVGQKCSFESLVQSLTQLGYERKAVVADKAEFAVRGGIIDIFPVTHFEPFRIEFFGDEIESIRPFDTGSQKSHGHISSCEISLANEIELSQNSNTLTTLFDYLGPNCLVIFDDLLALEDRYANLTSLGAHSSKQILGIEAFLALIQEKQKVFFVEQPIETLSSVTVDQGVKYYSRQEKTHDITFEIFQKEYQALRWNHPFMTIEHFLQQEDVVEEIVDTDELLIAATASCNTQLFFVVQNEQEQTRLTKKLTSLTLPQAEHMIYGYLSCGFSISSERAIIFPMTEITHRRKIRRERQRAISHFTATDAFDIAPGETIVHFHHGIGTFSGIEKKKNSDGEEQEFFALSYADNAKIFVPLTQANLITKYIGAGSKLPQLHTIGSQKWKKQRERTEQAIVGYAAELLKLYATRSTQKGFCCPQDSSDIHLFEEEFPYIETNDQLQAISAVKADMCSEKVMDRLVCGDVGYGKTEVALRAAFKAVLDGGKQVAMLVPTTVLALQHYENFVDRMEKFGVRIEMLSRFRKPKEITRILEKIADKKIDIVIGTHRLIQNDVHFADLGLLIIDEEQRLGVKAKEYLKRLKTHVDCLTLTATPIPRTLYMSLIGARDLSVIATPPQDRVPVKTVIAAPDEILIKTALLRELNRDGQAFFIHNRIESIFETAHKLQNLLPKARIVVGHGQMDPDELDLVFHAFKKKDADILVATSIIENGIDIPSANTIIIDNAHYFGISELYQLRGRVGRWNKRASAYLLLPKRARLSPIATQRLEALLQASGYGGGMKVAMRDLEMRGAGDILGLEQSGHVTEIGFHLYCKILKRTVESLQGKAPSWTIDTKVDIPFVAKIDEYYINDVHLRMEIYQRLADALTLEEVDVLWQEVVDRFGRPPEHALSLYHLYRIRVFVAKQGITLLKVDNFTLYYEKKGGTETITNKLLIGRVSTCQQLEQKIFKLFQ